MSPRTEPTTQPRVVTGLPSVFVLVEDERDLPLLPLTEALGPATVLSVTNAEHAEVAFLHGAEHVVTIWDDALSGVDYLGIGHVLACAVRHLCELRGSTGVIVIAGDRGRGAVGPAVAERLSVPHFGAVSGVSLDKNGLAFDRRIGSALRAYRGAPPAVLCLPLSGLAATATEAPRDRVVASLDLATLGITPAELTYRRNFLPTAGATPRRKPHVVASTAILIDRLVRDGIWPVARGKRRKGEG